MCFYKHSTEIIQDKISYHFLWTVSQCFKTNEKRGYYFKFVIKVAKVASVKALWKYFIIYRDLMSIKMQNLTMPNSLFFYDQ